MRRLTNLERRFAKQVVWLLLVYLLLGPLHQALCSESGSLESFRQKVRDLLATDAAFLSSYELEENLRTDLFAGLQEALIRPLLAGELLPLQAEQLRLLRNEIFARHGYRFKSEDLRNYFSRQDWYRPSDTFKSSDLSEIERQNVVILKRFEQLKLGREEGFVDLLNSERHFQCEPFQGENETIIVTDQSLTFKDGMHYLQLESTRVPHAGGYQVSHYQQVCLIDGVPEVFLLDLDHEFLVTGASYADGVTVFDRSGRRLYRMPGGGEDFRYYPDFRFYLSEENRGCCGVLDGSLVLSGPEGQTRVESQGWKEFALFVPTGGKAPLLWILGEGGGEMASPGQAHDRIVALSDDGKVVRDFSCSLPYQYVSEGLTYAGYLDPQTVYLRFTDSEALLHFAAPVIEELVAGDVVPSPRFYLSSNSHQYTGLRWPLTEETGKAVYFDRQSLVDSPADIVYADEGRKVFVSQGKDNGVYLFSMDDIESGVPDAKLEVGYSEEGARLAVDHPRRLLFVAIPDMGQVKVYDQAAQGIEPPLFSFTTAECKAHNLFWDANQDRLYLACGSSRSGGVQSYLLDFAAGSAEAQSAFTPFVVLAQGGQNYYHGIYPSDLYINHEKNEVYLVGDGFYDGAMLTVPANLFTDYPEQNLFFAGDHSLYFKKEKLGQGWRRETWDVPDYRGDDVRLVIGNAKADNGNRIDIFFPDHLYYDAKKEQIYVFNKFGLVNVYAREADTDYIQWQVASETYRKVKPERRFTFPLRRSLGLDARPEIGEIALATPSSGIHFVRLADEGEKLTPFRSFRSKKPFNRSDERRSIAFDPENGQVFIADAQADAVYVYAPRDGGMQRIGSLSGEASGVKSPMALAVDGRRDALYVLNNRGYNKQEIRVFSLQDRGDVAPRRVLSGVTGGAEDLAVSPETGELFVVPGDGGGLVVISPDAKGPAEAVRVVEGADTGIIHPVAVAIDDHRDEIFVALADGDILCFDRNASGRPKPKRHIRGKIPLRDLTVDSSNARLYALTREDDKVLVYRVTADGHSLADEYIALGDAAVGDGLIKGVTQVSGLAVGRD